MVLVLNGVLQEESPVDSRTLFHNHPIYREAAARHLLAHPRKLVGPQGLLYVQQREMAATTPHDKYVSILGSDDATTCIITVVRHSGSGAVALAHFDGVGVDEAVTTMVARVQELAMGYAEGRIELQLVGGYSDPNHYSEELFYNIMSAFHKQPVEIDLTLACVGELNTSIRGGIHWPLVYGIAVNVKTGEIFPANFQDKGPDHELRLARHITNGGNQVLDVYDSNVGMLRIGPFNYDPLRGVDLWLAQSDEVILQHLSTSPDVEPPHYVMEMRAALKYIQDNPFPAVTVFRDNRPRYFRRDEHTGLWVLYRF
ncbi:protein N-terminal asparagine amidohydrolase [Chrysoperla carnea]|uniref:protein N-terminal asparagine amidohydrolase n=1 Tax=Chrysoperla carnea TaxID=189513 RepID=UPI001D0767D7|nr:protein N-terminal asparagine amidohydrolase [Chrysoperla carnea]XP_044735792.1 protein N-terminal asparagine amidohydrolase [Chrysoperla carnea]XP_044735793.1 protein N-terminal asparagine amidohydrolase [Chrysoperla carnea]